MISVIVPVYNVELYLRKCLDNIVEQTYRDLEILVIDDGSTDGSGRICDEFSERDERIRVYHTENHGLSAARNLGIENANGEYLGFVDSDDWIESDMYEMLIRKAIETDADVVECGSCAEYQTRTILYEKECVQVSGVEAIHLLLCEKLTTTVWDKLWKRKCFNNISFPNGRVFEDVATTFRLYEAAEKVCSIKDCKYHNNVRMNSISRTRNMKNLVDYWISQHEWYEYLYDHVNDEDKLNLLWFCARATARMWALYYDCSKDERSFFSDEMREMNTFINKNTPLFGLKEWGSKMRVGVFFPHFYNTVSLCAAWLMVKMVKKSLIFDYSVR